MYFNTKIKDYFLSCLSLNNLPDWQSSVTFSFVNVCAGDVPREAEVCYFAGPLFGDQYVASC